MTGPGFVNRTQSDPGFVNPVRSGPGFVNPIRSDPVRVLLTPDSNQVEMPNGTGNFRNFQISRKKDNLQRLSTIFETNFQKLSVPFDFVPEFPEILVKWIASEEYL